MTAERPPLGPPSHARAYRPRVYPVERRERRPLHGESAGGAGGGDRGSPAAADPTPDPPPPPPPPARAAAPEDWVARGGAGGPARCCAQAAARLPRWGAEAPIRARERPDHAA